MIHIKTMGVAKMSGFKNIVISLLIFGSLSQWIMFFQYIMPHMGEVKLVKEDKLILTEILVKEMQNLSSTLIKKAEYSSEDNRKEGKSFKKPIKPIDQKQYLTINWVCIRSRKPTLTFNQKNENGWKWHLRNEEILMPARDCVTIPQKSITIHGQKELSALRKFRGFYVKYSNKPLPEDYKIIEDRVAFFNYQDPNKYPCRLYNFYHFITQEFFPLYSTMKSTDRLGLPNDAFFAIPSGFCPGKFVPFDLSATKPFLEMLGVNDTNMSIFEDNQRPDKVCYKTAIFNSALLLDTVLDATDFIKRKLHVKEECPYENLVVITQRGSYRRILNAKELKIVAIEMGYNASVVIMEKLSLIEQAQLIHCTRVLVGVKGAAMTWSVALKNYSGVIEIAWPKKEWPFYFTATRGRQARSPLIGIRPLNMTQIAVENCKIEPWYLEKYYEGMFLVKSNFTQNDIKDILKHKANYGFLKNYVMSLGKLCDIFVPKDKFKTALETIRTSKNRLIF